MLGITKLINWCVLGVAVLMLNACANAVFPDFEEDEDDVLVAEGGRVERELPKEGNSLRADKENVAYEDGEDEEPVENIVAAETTPVIKSEIEESIESKDEVVETIEETKMAEVEDLTPSVSYRVETIYFANGSTVVDSSYNGALRKVVKEAKKNNATIIVYGYASSRTRNTDPASHKLANFKVSLERAQNVADALKKAGMPEDKISIEALSDTAPAYLEVMPEGERLNRRAELYLSF